MEHFVVTLCKKRPIVFEIAGRERRQATAMRSAVYKATTSQPGLVQAPASMLRVTGRQPHSVRKHVVERKHAPYLPEVSSGSGWSSQGESDPKSVSFSRGRLPQVIDQLVQTQHFQVCVQVGVTVGREAMDPRKSPLPLDLPSHHREMTCNLNRPTSQRAAASDHSINNIATSYVPYSGLDIDNVMVDIKTPQSQPWPVGSIHTHEAQPTKWSGKSHRSYQQYRSGNYCPEPRGKTGYTEVEHFYTSPKIQSDYYMITECVRDIHQTHA